MHVTLLLLKEEEERAEREYVGKGYFAEVQEGEERHLGRLEVQQ